MARHSSNSISSDTSTLNNVSWPGRLDVSRRTEHHQAASESLRSMIHALGSEKMGRLRSVISEPLKKQGDQLPTIQQPSDSDPISPVIPSDTLRTSDGIPPDGPAEEVDLTICYLESALGVEDMSQLKESMNTVRRQSEHVDFLISSDMTEEELQCRVEAVKQRQDEVLEQLFVAIMDLVAAKLGIELDLPEPLTMNKEPVVTSAATVAKTDVTSMLKVPKVDSTGRQLSVATNLSQKKKDTRGTKPDRHKKPFELSFYGIKTVLPAARGLQRGVDEVLKGKVKGKGEKIGSTTQDATSEKAKAKKKSKRGCFGFFRFL